MNVLQHTRNELNLCLKENRPDRSYRDTLLNFILWLTLPDLQCTTSRVCCTGYATVKSLWIKSTNGGKRYHTLNPEPSRMTSPGKEWLNVEGAMESGARSKRRTRPTQKALQSAVELKRRQILRSRKRLLSVINQ